MRKLKPLSRIMFERQTAQFEGETIQCFNLAEILAALAVLALLAAAAVLAVFAMEATR